MIELECITDSLGAGSEWYAFEYNDTLYQLIRYKDQSLFWLNKRETRNLSISYDYYKKFGWVKTANYRIDETFLKQVSLEEAKLLIELDTL